MEQDDFFGNRRKSPIASATERCHCTLNVVRGAQTNPTSFRRATVTTLDPSTGDRPVQHLIGQVVPVI